MLVVNGLPPETALAAAQALAGWRRDEPVWGARNTGDGNVFRSGVACGHRCASE